KIINVKVKNRTGAGDTFAAGFLAKLYESIKSAEDYRKKTDDEKEWIFKVCLLFATSAAAVKISKGLAPTREEIIKMLEKNEN
ncbi:MAG: hypothetical protein GY870_21685, partial [archaeon]|nr:hypothetical protein [archaeon]